MGHAQHAAGIVGDHHRQAIGHHHGQHPARPRRDAGVGGRLLRRGGIVGVDDIGAVNLPQPQRLGRQRGAQAPAVLGHSVGIVLGATAEIEGVVRRHADAAGARGAEILDAGPLRAGHHGQSLNHAFHTMFS